MASNGSRGIDANDKDDQERFDIVLAPYRKNRRLLRVKSLPFAETRVRVEAFLKSKLAKPDSASFNWPPSSGPSGHDGVVFRIFQPPSGTTLSMQMRSPALWQHLDHNSAFPAPPPPGTTAYTAAPMLPFVSAEQFRLGTMERLQAFLQDEMRTTTDGDRMRMSAAFFLNEIRIRRERYGNAGAGAPSDAAS
ncbi:uncharacterized protein N0V96_007715 [Colletotrichum fioriniae]|uniref:uncharacterized protein n=1 Tax=Colletotrichum fioriniae TaxID=710243 RepID=UPI0032D9F2EC|nr:hypothetical protein N0V96_007715 [Colletotrichum fioriniae]